MRIMLLLDVIIPSSNRLEFLAPSLVPARMPAATLGCTHPLSPAGVALGGFFTLFGRGAMPTAHLPPPPLVPGTRSMFSRGYRITHADVNNCGDILISGGSCVDGNVVALRISDGYMKGSRLMGAQGWRGGGEARERWAWNEGPPFASCWWRGMLSGGGDPGHEARRASTDLGRDTFGGVPARPVALGDRVGG